jgi:hypothetical protein
MTPEVHTFLCIAVMLLFLLLEVVRGQRNRRSEVNGTDAKTQLMQKPVQPFEIHSHLRRPSALSLRSLVPQRRFILVFALPRRSRSRSSASAPPKSQHLASPCSVVVNMLHGFLFGLSIFGIHVAAFSFGTWVAITCLPPAVQPDDFVRVSAVRWQDELDMPWALIVHRCCRLRVCRCLL